MKFIVNDRITSVFLKVGTKLRLNKIGGSTYHF